MEALREDAERWRAFIAIALDGNVELPNVDITYTTSGYNGGQWSTVELCWKHPQGTGWTKDHADAAIDAARKAPATRSAT